MVRYSSTWPNPYPNMSLFRQHDLITIPSCPFRFYVINGEKIRVGYVSKRDEHEINTVSRLILSMTAFRGQVYVYIDRSTYRWPTRPAKRSREFDGPDITGFRRDLFCCFLKEFVKFELGSDLEREIAGIWSARNWRISLCFNKNTHLYN